MLFFRLKFQQESESRALLIRKTNEFREERSLYKQNDKVIDQEGRPRRIPDSIETTSTAERDTECEYGHTRQYDHQTERYSPLLQARQKFENVVLKKLQEGVKVSCTHLLYSRIVFQKKY